MRIPSRMLLVLLVAVAAIPARAPAQEVVPRGIVALLDARGRAYETRDRSLLASTLTENAFGQDQLKAFDAAREVELEHARWSASTRFSGDVASARVRASYPGSDVAAFHVVEETQVAGVEPVPFVEDAFYTFARGGADASDPYDGWRLVSDADFDVLGLQSPHHLWYEGSVRVVRSDHFALLAHPRTIDAVGPVLEQAEAALADVLAFWPDDVHDRYVIIVPSSTAELGRILQSTVDLTKFVAFAAGSADRDDGWEPRAARLFINLPNFLRYDAGGRRSILEHELIHAVTRPVSGPFVPVWVEEGLAMIGSEPGSGVRGARGGSRPDGFPTDDEFFVGPTADIVRVYSRAQVALEVLRDRSGVEGVAAFYERLGAARVAPGTVDHHLDAAARDALGWSIAQWERAWLDEVA